MKNVLAWPKNALAWLVNNTFWRLVFLWKKQTGWMDLGQTVECTGVIVAVDMNVTGIFNDGDVCFNVKLDTYGPNHDPVAPDLQNRYITAFGGRLTSEDGNGPSIHCEIPPWVRDKFDGKWQQLAVGKRVRVKGAWGFDGVHTGRAEWIEIILALFRHQPNVRDGWFEIHPVEELEFLP